MLFRSRRHGLTLVAAAAISFSYGVVETDAAELAPQNSDVSQQTEVVQKTDAVQKGVKMVWETRMETRSRTVYENVTETKEKVVYDTHYDTKTTHDVHRVAETHYRHEDFTYQVPYFDTQVREIPYTLHRPVYETRSRDMNYVTYVLVPETRTRHIPYTTYHTVEETRTRTVPYTVPREVPYTKTITINTGCWETQIEERPGPVIRKCIQEPGCWEWDAKTCCCIYVPGKSRIVETHCPPIKCCKRVWVPRTEEKIVNCTKTVYETQTKQVPFTVTRLAPETHTREETYTINRQVPVTNTRTVYYQVANLVPEQHTRTVTQLVRRMTAETGTRTVPYTVWKEVPSERTITVPRKVPRTVTYTVTKCVPRTESYQVEVRVCRPVTKGTSPLQRTEEPAPVIKNERVTPVAAEVAASNEPSDRDVTLTAIAQASVNTPPNESENPQQLFHDGLRQFHLGDFTNARTAIARAAELDATNAKYAYFWALSAKQSGQLAEAQRALSVAAQREQVQPVENWGQVMTRVQGNLRLWLEQARRDAQKS